MFKLANGNISGAVRWAAVLAVVAGAWQPAPSSAGNVRDIFSNLYGGDGITLSAIKGGGHAGHFDTTSIASLLNLGQGITSSASIISLNSAITSVTYDLERGIPVRTTDSLGPILTERAATIGKGKLNLGADFTRTVYKKFNGTNLSNLHVNIPHESGGTSGCPGQPYCAVVVSTTIDFELEQNTLSLSGTYGVSRYLEAGMVVPLVYVRARARAYSVVTPASLAMTPPIHAFGPDGDKPNDDLTETATGLGDIALRAKYDLTDVLQTKADRVIPNFGVFGQLTLPTGNEKDLLGSGETSLLALLIASKQYDWFGPHLNGGYEASTGSSALDNVRYAAGFDARVSQEFTLAFDLIGRWHPEGDGSRDHIDVAMGGKLDPFGTGALFSVNVLVPVNKDTGLRPDFAWNLGFQMSF